MNRIELLKTYLLDAPDDPFLYFALAKEYEKLNLFDEAQEHYEHLMKVHPTYLGTYYHAGKLLEIQAQWERALDCYDQGMTTAREAGERQQLRELQEARILLENRLLSDV